MIPRFYVVARINGADGALNKVPRIIKKTLLNQMANMRDQWVERFTGLCKATATEPMSLTYYWGTDQDGETDVLWGLEGYSHPVGFFVGHGQSAEFKHEMSLIDEDNLLRNIQGFPSPDYDLHYYDFEGGWLTREDDPLRDSKESFVAVVHFWAKEGKRKEVMKKLGDFATCASSLQSCAVLKECMDANLTTLWLR